MEYLLLLSNVCGDTLEEEERFHKISECEPECDDPQSDGVSGQSASSG